MDALGNSRSTFNTKMSLRTALHWNQFFVSASHEHNADLSTTSQRPRVPLQLLLTVIVIFGLDWITPLGFAVYMLYVPLCLTTLWHRGWQFAFVVGGVCSMLIFVGFFVSPSGSLFTFSLADRTMALLTLGQAFGAESYSPYAPSSLSAPRRLHGKSLSSGRVQNPRYVGWRPSSSRRRIRS